MGACGCDLQLYLRARELEVERLALHPGRGLASDLLVQAEDVGRRASWEGAGLRRVGPGDDGVVELLGDAAVVCHEVSKPFLQSRKEKTDLHNTRRSSCAARQGHQQGTQTASSVSRTSARGQTAHQPPLTPPLSLHARREASQVHASGCRESRT